MRSQRVLTFFLVCIYILVSINAFAAKITGIVTDEKNEPLIGVMVILKNTDKGTQTDPDGKYEIANVEDGSYEVLFTMLTYKKVLKTIIVTKGEDIILNVTLKEEGKNLSELTIRSNKITHTENAVLMEIRKSNTIVSGISSQQIQKTMDRNAADVVKRIPGVTIMDDRFIMVRGLNDRYNSVWLNDVGAPSSETDKKSFSFDVIPSGQIDRILISKTPAPELPGDFAGGMVKVYTTSIPDKNIYTLGYQVSGRQYTTGSKLNYNEPSKTDWLGFDDGSRNLPQGIPDSLTRINPDIENITKKFKNNFVIKTKNVTPDMRFNASAANVFKIKKLRIGNVFAINYTKTTTNWKIDRYDYADSNNLENKNYELLSVQNASSALMDNIGVAWGNNKVEFKNLYNQIGRASIIDRYNVPDSETQEPYFHDYNMAYESRAVYTTQLTGTHKSNDDNRRYIWSLGYTDLFKNMPDVKRLRYAHNYADEDSAYALVIAQQPAPLFGSRVYGQLYEKLYCFSHQFSQKINIARRYQFEVTAGNYVEYKSRAYQLKQYGYTLTPSSTNPIPFSEFQKIKRININSVFAEENLGGPNKFMLEEILNYWDRYTAKNMLIASFIALKLPAPAFLGGDKLTLYGGIRHEYNNYTLIAMNSFGPIEPVIKTNFILPSVNISYSITPKQLVRIAYGKTLNRPEFRENSSFYFYDLETRWGILGALKESLVNKFGDTLDVSTINNIDARWEWYPSGSEMVQFGAFYKGIKNPIQQVIENPYGDNRSYTFANLKKGYSYGVELDIRKNLGFADNWLNTNFFRCFSFVGNAALIKSNVTPDTNVHIKDAPIQGQSPYMYNAGLYYQNDSLGLQATVLYNVFGPRIFSLGATDDRVGNIWELPFHAMDITVSQRLYKYFTISFGVQNLLDQTIRTAQDVDYDNKIKGDLNSRDNLDQPIMRYKPGRYYTFGVKVKL